MGESKAEEAKEGIQEGEGRKNGTSESGKWKRK